MVFVRLIDTKCHLPSLSMMVVSGVLLPSVEGLSSDGFSSLFICLFVCRITQYIVNGFHENFRYKFPCTYSVMIMSVLPAAAASNSNFLSLSDTELGSWLYQ